MAPRVHAAGASGTLCSGLGRAEQRLWHGGGGKVGNGGGDSV